MIMLEFIKMFGLGILYTILSPIILAVFLLFVVYSLFNYLVFEVINFVGFFAGKRFSAETALDKKLKKMRAQGQSTPVDTRGGDYNA